MAPCSFTPFPELRTEHMTLRRLTPADADALFVLRTNPELNRYLTRPVLHTVADAADTIAMLNGGVDRDEWVVWAMALHGTGAVVGTICLWNVVWELALAEVGYELHPDYQGRGLMTQALAAVLDYGFGAMALHTIEARTLAANARSVRLLEGHNFKRDPLAEHTVSNPEKKEDSRIYILTCRQRRAGVGSM